MPTQIGSETPDVSTYPIGPYTVTTTLDFFYPLNESPYMFGRIAICNVLSDLYAMGIQNIAQVLMILGVSTEMSQIEKDVVTTLMIQGFSQTAQQAKTRVGGGQSVYNMWPMLGGCAIGIVKDNEFRWPYNAKPGDKLILTKPLGTRLAINTMQWLKSNKQKRQKVIQVISESKIHQAFYAAQESMATLSIVGARLLKKYQSHACTDVTGFGILGHANYLAQAQKQKVKFIINKLPVFKQLHKLQSLGITSYKLFQGYAAQTSGGLLIALDPSQVQPFLKQFQSYGLRGWQIGYVTEGNNSAQMSSKLQIIQC